jgi:ABC-2 type transport system permease protein
MRLYFEVARCALRRQTAYTAANWAGAATNIFWGCLRSFVFVALYEARPEVAGYRLDDALAYVWLTQALIAFCQIWGWWEISATIRTGAVAIDLARPFDYYLYWLSQDAGRAVYFLLLRALPIYGAGALLFGVGVPTSSRGSRQATACAT